jgi:hypothetical protein
MRLKNLTVTTTLVAGAALATVAACASDSTGPGGSVGPRQVSVSFSTAPSSDAAASLGVSNSVSATSGSDTLVISKAQLVLARVELRRVGATCPDTADAGDDHDDDRHCAELELAPTVIDLPVDTSVASALKVNVPSGTYSAFEAKIRPVRVKSEGGGSASAAFLAAHPELVGASVRVEGTFNGKAFTYTGAPRAEIESEFNPPVSTDSTGVNVTMHADLTTWFRNFSGALIDPATANKGQPNAALVASNIRRSLRSFRDDNRNGHDDDDDRRRGRR